MRRLVVGCAVLALGACTDIVEHFPGPEYFVAVTPRDHATNAGGTPIVVQVETWEGEIPAKLVQTLATEVTLRDASGKSVAVTVESSVSTRGADGGEAWCRSDDNGAWACVRLTPKQPLADGWYDFETGPGLETHHLNKWAQRQSHFHVGSLPQIVKVSVYEKGGLNGGISFSEPMVAEGSKEAICPRSLQTSECWTVEMQGESNDSAWFYSASGTVQDEIVVNVKPGAKATTGEPLRDAQGNESFVITLGPVSTVSPPTREWGP